MKTAQILVLVVSLFFSVSCSSIRPLSSKPPYSAITVNKPFSQGDGVILIRVEMPTGDYKPLYEDDQGYYYQAPQKLTGRDSFWPLLMDGGLYIKRASTRPNQIYFIRGEAGIPGRFNITNQADLTLKP